MRPFHVSVLFVALALVPACSSAPGGDPCTDCSDGLGGFQISLPITSADVVRVRATVTAVDLAAPIASDLALGGSPVTATGTIRDIPVGTGRTITVTAFPALPGTAEAAVVIYRGETSVDIVAGQLASASVTLRPVVGDVAVSASFPAGDLDVADVHHVSVVTEGARIAAPATFYLALANGVAAGLAEKVPVGLARNVTVRTFRADGTPLHRGSAQVDVAEQNSAVAVVLENITGLGGAGLTGNFCQSSCSNKVCGDDGCGGSCGGCMPGDMCHLGACSPAFGVTSAAAKDATTLDVSFAAPPSLAEAESVANYCIATGTPAACNGALAITGATLSGSTVTLTTAAQGPSAPYTVYVVGVTRASDGAPLVRASAAFSGFKPFTLASATAKGPASVQLTFSDAVVATGAAVDPSGYCIVLPPATDCSNPAVPVAAASLTGPAEVALATGPLTPNVGYRVLVTGDVRRGSDTAPLSTRSADFEGFNLLVNGSFEEQTGSTLTGWTTTTSASAPLTASTGPISAQRGANVARFPSLTSSASGREASSGCIQVGAGAVTARGWLYTPQPVANTRASFKFYWFTDAACATGASTAANTQTSVGLTASATWQENSYTQTPPADAQFVKFAIRASFVSGTGASTDEVYFDDLSLSQ
ncbi:MAG: hypothetical protein RL653_267 [Pseudomonadota bacterium]|jgi:hypothetical protein